MAPHVCDMCVSRGAQGYWGTGYFNEDAEKAPVNLLRSVESKKLLSTAGKLKLLSSADKAGFNLAKVCMMIKRRVSSVFHHTEGPKYGLLTCSWRR